MISPVANCRDGTGNSFNRLAAPDVSTESIRDDRPAEYAPDLKASVGEDALQLVAQSAPRRAKATPSGTVQVALVDDCRIDDIAGRIDE